MKPPGSLPRTIAAIVSGFIALANRAHAGTVHLVDGTVLEGDVSIDGGILVKGPTSVKLAFTKVLIARFTNAPTPNEYPPGIVLTNGTRVAGSFTRLDEPTVRIDRKGIRIPREEVAWLVYHAIPAAQAASIPAGKTGALLPGGDFFEGAPKGADGKEAKVVNSIFGPRTFSAARKEVHALVVRGVASQPASYAIYTRDGSRYLAQDLAARDNAALVLRHPHYDGLQIEAADVVEIRAMPHRLILFAERPPAPDREPPAEIRPGPGIRLVAGGSRKWALPTSGGAFFARISTDRAESISPKLSFVVLADDRVVFRSQPVEAGVVQLLRCPIPAANAITLRVEGTEGTGAWLDPILVLP